MQFCQEIVKKRVFLYFLFSVPFPRFHVFFTHFVPLCAAASLQQLHPELLCTRMGRVPRFFALRRPPSPCSCSLSVQLHCRTWHSCYASLIALSSAFGPSTTCLPPPTTTLMPHTCRPTVSTMYLPLGTRDNGTCPTRNICGQSQSLAFFVFFEVFDDRRKVYVTIQTEATPEERVLTRRFSTHHLQRDDVSVSVQRMPTGVSKSIFKKQCLLRPYRSTWMHRVPLRGERELSSPAAALLPLRTHV